jgi:ribulose-5-phosphate 4-epimerase/fuculose-1-phosphate aldolase
LTSKVIKNLGERFSKMDPKDLIEVNLKESHTKKKAIKTAEETRRNRWT